MSDEIKLEVLICATNEKINYVIDNILPQLSDVLVLVSHQVTSDHFIVNHSWPKNVRYSVTRGVGAARNRNNCLKNMIGDICLLGDDDIIYSKNLRDTILNEYSMRPESDAITFQAKGLERWKKRFTHNKRSVGQVAAWMITFKKDFVRKNQIFFDERFGPAAKYSQGEENIFLADIRKKGGVVNASPQIIVHHPDISSGYIFNEERSIAKVAVARRMYGWWTALFILFLFTWTKRSLYRKANISSLRFLYLGLKFLTKRNI
jgi:hypothetical protein